jgi:hypothetical protein
MTHSITIEIPENIYQPLAEEAKAKGRKVEEIALELLEMLMSDRKLSDEEFEQLADLLADEFEKRLPPDAKPLSDYAMSREGIYEDHP